MVTVPSASTSMSRRLPRRNPTAATDRTGRIAVVNADTSDTGRTKPVEDYKGVEGGAVECGSWGWGGQSGTGSNRRRGVRVCKACSECDGAVVEACEGGFRNACGNRRAFEGGADVRGRRAYGDAMDASGERVGDALGGTHAERDGGVGAAGNALGERVGGVEAAGTACGDGAVNVTREPRAT